MLEEYLKGNSIIHKIDPRIKLVFSFLLSIIIAVTNRFSGAILGLAIGILIILLSGVRLRDVLKRIILVNGFILFLWIILPPTYQEKLVLKIFGIPIYEEGVILALLLTLKCNAIALIFLGLSATSNIFEIVHALHHLFIPNKVVALFFLIYRYSWVIFYEYERLVWTLKARGFNPRTSLYTYRAYGYIIGGLLVKSYLHGENLYRAMLARGFNGKFYLLDHFSFSWRDGIAGIILGFGSILIILLPWKIGF